MDYERRKRNLVNAAYAAAIIALVIFIFRYAIFWLMPFVFAFGVAFVTKPLTNRISRTLHVSRKPVAALVVALFYGTIGVLVAALGVQLVVSVRSWAVDLPYLYESKILPAVSYTYNNLLSMVENLNPEIAESLEVVANNMEDEITSLVTNISGTLISKISQMALSIPSMIIGVIFAVIGSFFIAMDYYRITNFLVGQFNPKNQEIIMDAKNYLVTSFFKIITSYGAIMCITFVELIIGFRFIGIERYVLLAACVAVMDIMPVLGTGAVMIPSIVFNVLTGNYRMALSLLAIYLIITVIRNIVEPKLVGHRVGIHPVLMLISMFIGGTVLGPLGIIVMPFMMIVIKNLNDTGKIHVYKNFRQPKPSWVAEKEGEQSSEHH